MPDVAVQVVNAFVSPSRTANFKLEFFTPTRQISHCGHATIATFSYLVQQGLLDGARGSTDRLRPYHHAGDQS